MWVHREKLNQKSGDFNKMVINEIFESIDGEEV